MTRSYKQDNYTEINHKEAMRQALIGLDAAIKNSSRPKLPWIANRTSFAIDNPIRQSILGAAKTPEARQVLYDYLLADGNQAAFAALVVSDEFTKTMSTFPESTTLFTGLFSIATTSVWERHTSPQGLGAVKALAYMGPLLSVKEQNKVIEIVGVRPFLDNTDVIPDFAANPVWLETPLKHRILHEAEHNMALIEPVLRTFVSKNDHVAIRKFFDSLTRLRTEFEYAALVHAFSPIFLSPLGTKIFSKDELKAFLLGPSKNMRILAAGILSKQSKSIAP